MAERPTVLLLSGPNLDQLGRREPEIYGSATLADHVATATEAGAAHGIDVDHLQSNHEGELIDALRDRRETHAAVVINAGALTHYSWALHDALVAFPGPVIELHLSNPYARESWRHRSVIAPAAAGAIVGFGGQGYRLALDAVAGLLEPGGPK